MSDGTQAVEIAPNAGTPISVTAGYIGEPRGDGYEAWREGLWRGFGRVEVEPATGERIQCRLRLAQISNLTLANGFGLSARFERSRRLLSDQCDDFTLIAASFGPVEVTLSGASATLQPSEMWLTEMSARCSCSFSGEGAITATRIPRQELLSICPRAEDGMGVALANDPAIRQAIAAYSDLSVNTGPLLDPMGRHLLAQHTIDMVALLLKTGPDQSELAQQRGYSAARLELIQNDIIKNLSDPCLTIAAVAMRQGCHPKQVQRLFAGTGSTFTEFVLEQRLQQARRLLSSPIGGSRKISEIAYDVGFSDLAYFNRTFRSRFGMTPSDCRFDCTVS
jgi:AraC-like DNA-binding protein